jgi:hypothetical protein
MLPLPHTSSGHVSWGHGQFTWYPSQYPVSGGNRRVFNSVEHSNLRDLRSPHGWLWTPQRFGTLQYGFERTYCLHLEGSEMYRCYLIVAWINIRTRIWACALSRKPEDFYRTIGRFRTSRKTVHTHQLTSSTAVQWHGFRSFRFLRPLPQNSHISWISTPISGEESDIQRRCTILHVVLILHSLMVRIQY